MVRRCLERLDDEGISGQLRILRVLSDTDPVATQGPVWYVGGQGCLTCPTRSPGSCSSPAGRSSTADGEDLGSVEEVLGDENADIFDGLTVATGLLGKPKHVPAELVGSIDTDAVHLTISAEEAKRLDQYEPPSPAS